MTDNKIKGHKDIIYMPRNKYDALVNRIESYKEFINLLVIQIAEFLTSLSDENISSDCKLERDELMNVLSPYLEQQFR